MLFGDSSGTYMCVFVYGLAALSQDEQDAVRLQTVDNCTALASVLPEEEQRRLVLPIVEETAKDKSVIR